MLKVETSIFSPLLAALRSPTRALFESQGARGCQHLGREHDMLGTSPLQTGCTTAGEAVGERVRSRVARLALHACQYSDKNHGLSCVPRVRSTLDLGCVPFGFLASIASLCPGSRSVTLEATTRTVRTFSFSIRRLPYSSVSCFPRSWVPVQVIISRRSTIREDSMSPEMQYGEGCKPVDRMN